MFLSLKRGGGGSGLPFRNRPDPHPAMKLGQAMASVKDLLGLGVPGIYRILCTCGASYIGHMGRNFHMAKGTSEASKVGEGGEVGISPLWLHHWTSNPLWG